METSPSLLERLRLPGQPAAWTRFVDLYTPMLFAFARRLGLNEMDAADLIQEIFLVLIDKLPQFQYDGSRSFRAWLWTIMRNKVAATHRKLRIRNAELPDLPAADELVRVWEDEYRQRLIERALEVMQRDFEPATWKACWEHTVSGRSAADVARELGLSVGAIYAAKFRVLARLRHELQDLLD